MVDAPKRLRLALCVRALEPGEPEGAGLDSPRGVVRKEGFNFRCRGLLLLYLFCEQVVLWKYVGG